ncbi:MAG TPA: hypothetical protein VK582_00720 [Pyrinomonadaceae bacterium]|nr:hypothetical protein [Pyrinomonadaceae bacterium]
MTTSQLQTLAKLIDESRKTLAAINAKPSLTGRFGEVEAFMDRIFDLALEVHRHPNSRDWPEFVGFLANCCSQMIDLMGDIQQFASRTEDQLYGSWDYDEWLEVCKRRSSLAFLMEFCGDINWPSFCGEYCASLDEQIRAKGKEEGYLKAEQIAEGIPSTHWWWWYPLPPGAEQDGSH